ncbi:tyrosine-type recombinase/integrase [Blautia glucerasea]|uniref:tyrosine-type recombinase/integrase n=1 Tax=Blautia glucerasea TaxID=536633 RepID=UPI001D5F862D|nr:tyrosine-type recombinase/integrase [Blautia glucerasea]NSL03366.1 tyrosine-type recombinase/integrase [Blautia glucerasea]
MQTNNSKEKVRQLQNKLYLTAKKCDSRRFHALYDKVYRDDVLFEAWKRVKANKGSSGVDGIKIEDVEAMGIEKYLSEIKSELMNGKYKPSPVKRVMIPKPDGSERPLGIPTVKDRIVQMATKIAIEPVFEADFRECSYGFRPKRSANIVNAYNKKESKLAEEEKREPELMPPISSHTLRHTGCTRLGENNVNPKVMQYVMGHSDAQITMNVYNHIAEKSHVENEMSKMNLPETVPAVV